MSISSGFFFPFPTQDIRLAEGEAGNDLRHLHHLLLVDGHPVGLLQDALQLGQRVDDRLAACLVLDVGVEVLHGAGGRGRSGR